MKRKTVKTLAMLLAIAIMAGIFAVPAMAAQTATGSTLRLERTSGTVTVKNSSGKAQTLKDGMRLYSGYSVKTSSSSSAYISLDGSKAIKLDSSTEVKLKKAGSKIELTVESGKMFFDVKVPIAGNESMDIRTSTMVTGVRGTAGWVEVLDVNESHLHLLEGTMEMVAFDPLTGEKYTLIVQGGQGARATRNITDGITELAYIENECMCRTPGFVAEEVKNDNTLQKKIREIAPTVDVDEIVEKADEWLAADEAAEQIALEEKKETLDSADKKVSNQVYEPEIDTTCYLTLPSNQFVTLTATAASTEPGGTLSFTITEPTVTDFYISNSLTPLGTIPYQILVNGAPVTPVDVGAGTYTVTIPDVYYDQVVTLQGIELVFRGAATPNIDEINTALAQPGVTTLESGALTVDSNLTIGTGKTLTVNGPFAIETGGTITNNGTLNLPSGDGTNNTGTIHNNGTITANAYFENNGTFNNNSGATLNAENEVANRETGVFTDRGSIVFGADGVFNNDGTFYFTDASIADATDPANPDITNPNYVQGVNGMWYLIS